MHLADKIICLYLIQVAQLPARQAWRRHASWWWPLHFLPRLPPLAPWHRTLGTWLTCRVFLSCRILLSRVRGTCKPFWRRCMQMKPPSESRTMWHPRHGVIGTCVYAVLVHDTAEPVEAHTLHGRALGETGRKYHDPAKSAWECRTKRSSDAVFAQVSRAILVSIRQSPLVEVQQPIP